MEKFFWFWCLIYSDHSANSSCRCCKNCKLGSSRWFSVVVLGAQTFTGLHWFHPAGRSDCKLELPGNMWKSDLRDGWTSESSLMHECVNWDCWCLRSLLYNWNWGSCVQYICHRLHRLVFKDALDFFELLGKIFDVRLWRKRAHVLLR